MRKLYQEGQTVPVSGEYAVVFYDDKTGCLTYDETYPISCDKGDPFPPTRLKQPTRRKPLLLRRPKPPLLRRRKPLLLKRRYYHCGYSLMHKMKYR